MREAKSARTNSNKTNAISAADRKNWGYICHQKRLHFPIRTDRFRQTRRIYSGAAFLLPLPASWAVLVLLLLRCHSP